MIDFSQINFDDVEVVKKFISHFGLAEIPDSLQKAMDDLQSDNTEENKEIFGKKLLEYLSSSDDLSKIDELFGPVQEAIIEANEILKETEGGVDE